MRETTSEPTQHVYRGPGIQSIHTPTCDAVAPEAIRIPTIADMVPITWVMSRNVICAREDLHVEALVDLMVQRRIGCVPVIDERGHPIGMVTKLDIIEQTRAARDPDATRLAQTVSQLMMPIALTLDEHATVAHAAAMMSIEDVHHVPIVAEGGELIGLVSTMDIVRWLTSNDGFLKARPTAE